MAKPCFQSDLSDKDYRKIVPRERIADIYKLFKDQIANKVPYHDAIDKLSQDIGLRPDWVQRAISEPKRLQPITNDVYRAQYERRLAVNKAKDFVNSADTPTYRKIADEVWRTPFGLAIAGHGTVGLFTHGGALMPLFRADIMDHWATNFGRQFKYSFKPAEFEKAAQMLQRDPMFTEKVRGGLAIDPRRVYTDYGAFAKYLPPFIRDIGNRGFFALKTLRNDLFDHYWNKVPDSIKNDPVARSQAIQRYSELVNHSTGVIDLAPKPTDLAPTRFIKKITSTVEPLAFAAKLEGSRWARLIGDPAKTVDTFLTWNKASAADRAIAMTRLKNATWFAGSFVGSLFVNNAILQATGSKYRVNLNDPNRSDWMVHRLPDGRTIKLEGALLAPVRLLAQLVSSQFNPAPWQKREKPYERLGGIASQYARGKAAPQVGIATDTFTGTDFIGRPLPTIPSLGKGWPANAQKPTPNRPRYTWGEYALQHGPIPLAGVTREIYQDFRRQGMSALQSTNALRWLGTLGAELTGVRVGDEPKK